MTASTLTWTQFQDQDLPDWRMLHSRVHARFTTGTFAVGLDLVDRIGQAAEAADHHPEVELTYGTVTVRMSSHDVGGVTARDVDLAREISGLAADLGVSAETDSLQVLELALDTHDVSAIRPFWAAVLGLSTEANDDEITDPNGALPTIWFQQAAPTDTPAQRFHLDIRVPREIAEARVEAAVAAGGTVVHADHAPAFWILADAQGNKACVCTGAGRDETSGPN